jgi:hypothetical protein
VRSMTTTLTARRPEDLVAAVPVVLGFRPHQSLVMLTFDAPRCFHARVDLPAAEELTSRVDELVDALLEPAVAQRVGRVVFVCYTDDASLAARVALPLHDAFTAQQIGVIDVLRAHDGHWWRVPSHPGGEESEASAYDEASHPFAAQAVFEGRVTLESRDALRETLAPDIEAQRRLADLIGSLPDPGPAEADWVRDRLVRCTADGCEPDEDDSARILRAVTRVEVRDAALFAVSPATAHDHLRVWSVLLRRAPQPQVAEAAVITAFCAWQAGHGALAWCALDRCLDADPGHPFGTCLAECLSRAVPPTAWEEVGAAGHSA